MTPKTGIIEAMDSQVSVVVLAGGKGTRMNSELPKVLHVLGGQPMIFRTLAKLKMLNPEQIVVVVGYRKDEVKNRITPHFDCQFAVQDQPLGSGHALKVALPVLFSGVKSVLVVNGDDSSFYSLETLEQFIASHQRNQAVASMMTLTKTGDHRLGRVLRRSDGRFEQTMEAAEYFMSGMQSDEINCGAYVFDVDWLHENIEKVPLNEKGEYYITELFNMAREEDQLINLYTLTNESEWVGVNTQDELTFANQLIGRVE